MPFLYPCNGLGSSGTLVIFLQFDSLNSAERMGVGFLRTGPQFES